MNTLDRFWAKVDRGGPDDCWPWLAGGTGGYGVFSIRKPLKSLAHRFAYEALVGSIPPGMQLDHECHNRAAAAGECLGGAACPHRGCVNPAHLRVASLEQNVMSGLGVGAQNAMKTHCLRRHPFDEENTFVDSRGFRHCRACGRDRKRERRAAGALD